MGLDDQLRALAESQRGCFSTDQAMALGATRDLHVTRVRDGSFPEGALARVHTTRVLPDDHVAPLDGVLVTTPARTLFDLAAGLHPGRVERLLDRAWSQGLVTVPVLERTLRQLSRRGRGGLATMRSLIDARKGAPRRVSGGGSRRRTRARRGPGGGRPP